MAVVFVSVFGVAGASAFVGMRHTPKPAQVAPTSRPPATPTPPARSWSRHSEEEWLVGEVARDILEMVVAAKGPSALGKSGLAVGVASLPGAAASYEVTAPIGPQDPPFRHRIVLYDHVWASTNYESLARAAIERTGLKASTTKSERPGAVASALVNSEPRGRGAGEQARLGPTGDRHAERWCPRGSRVRSRGPSRCARTPAPSRIRAPLFAA